VTVGGGPGAGDLFNPDDHDDVLNRLVLPVVTSLVRPDELKAVQVGWGPFSDRLKEVGLSAGWNRDLWVLVAAAGKTLEWRLWDRDSTQNRPDDTVGKMAWDFAQRLEQWVDDCLGWGEDHEARYVIPAAPRRADLIASASPPTVSGMSVCSCADRHPRS
jgi:hypothetical protein